MKKLLVILSLAFAAVSFQAGAATLDWVSTPAGSFATKNDDWNLFGTQQNIHANTTVSDDWTFNVTGSGIVSIFASNVPVWVSEFTLDGVDILADAFGASGFLSAVLTGQHTVHVAGITGPKGFSGYQFTVHTPIPAAVWLFGSALMGMMGVTRRKIAQA